MCRGPSRRDRQKDHLLRRTRVCFRSSSWAPCQPGHGGEGFPSRLSSERVSRGQSAQCRGTGRNASGGLEGLTADVAQEAGSTKPSVSVLLREGWNAAGAASCWGSRSRFVGGQFRRRSHRIGPRRSWVLPNLAKGQLSWRTFTFKCDGTGPQMFWSVLALQTFPVQDEGAEPEHGLRQQAASLTPPGGTRERNGHCYSFQKAWTLLINSPPIPTLHPGPRPRGMPSEVARPWCVSEAAAGPPVLPHLPAQVEGGRSGPM